MPSFQASFVRSEAFVLRASHTPSFFCFSLRLNSQNTGCDSFGSVDVPSQALKGGHNKRMGSANTCLEGTGKSSSLGVQPFSAIAVTPNTAVMKYKRWHGPWFTVVVFLKGSVGFPTLLTFSPSSPSSHPLLVLAFLSFFSFWLFLEMLNVHAKSFVPSGAAAAPVYGSSPLYRYRINVSPWKKTAPSPEAINICNVSSLLSSKRLFGVRGPMDDATLQLFVSEEILNSTNEPPNEVAEQPSSGFLLCRSMLDLYTSLTSTNTVLNESAGFLIRLDIPKQYGEDVTTPLSTAWEFFFAAVGHDYRVNSLGYSYTVAGLNAASLGGTYRHYFFVSCAPSNSAGEGLQISGLANLGLPYTRIVAIKGIIPFISNPQSPMCVVITVGQAAKEVFLKWGKVDHSFEVEYCPTSFERTRESLHAFEDGFLGVLERGGKWERSYIAHLHVSVTASPGFCCVPIWDVIEFVGLLCDDTASTVAGVSFSSEDEVPGSRDLLLANKRGPFFVNASFDTITGSGLSLDMSTTIFGGAPQHIKRSMTRELEEAAGKAVNFFLGEEKLHQRKEQLLTRMTFAEAADQFARSSFCVRRRKVGSPVLVGTDAHGDVFCVDIETSSTFSLPRCFGGVNNSIAESVFKGTLVSSFKGQSDYRIIIDDVLVYQDADVRDVPFEERWGFVEEMGLDEEDTWPHTAPEHVVVLRANYVTLKEASALLSNPSHNHATLGLVFVPNKMTVDANSGTEFTWIPAIALSLRFSVGRVEDVPDSEEGLRRVFLSVRKSETDDTLMPYGGEYADYEPGAYPDVETGATVECLLRRADDGAHWWDLLREFQYGGGKVATFDEVDTLVHSPGVTQDEMLWLREAPSYQCARCKRVNDMGKRNPRYNVYWCKNCWRETGHGDCVYCGRGFALGMLDGPSQLFYCENCWRNFATINTQAEIGYHVPPPPNASFTQQVMTRCVSLLIDLISPKSPTNDVLDLCCGGSVTRKWMRNKTNRYVGIDLKASVVDSVLELITNSSRELPPNARYDAICADTFSDDFWTSTIMKIHPRQFHVIACFAGLHHAFDSEERARHFVASVANALVPGGTFVGIFMDASVLYTKGDRYANSVFRVTWESRAVPRIGHRFEVSTENGPLRQLSVIPIDFLIAVAGEYGLSVTSEACQTLRELIEKDASWTKVPNADEKEYLCAFRTFVFKKESGEQAPTKPR